MLISHAFLVSFGRFFSIVSELVESALREERDTCAVDAVNSVFMSVLNAPGLDVREKKAAIIDFIASGMQTVSLFKLKYGA
jgi:ecdysone 20-monooxygenase